MGTPRYSSLPTPPGGYAPHEETRLLPRAPAREDARVSTGVPDPCTGTAGLAPRIGGMLPAVHSALRGTAATRAGSEARVAGRPVRSERRPVRLRRPGFPASEDDLEELVAIRARPS